MLAPLLFNTSTHPKYPLGSRTVVFEAQAVLIHDEEGFYALSTTCTHLECQVEVGSDGFTCPCHRSAFDSQEKVLSGPAIKSLTRLAVKEVEIGELVLRLA